MKEHGIQACCFDLGNTLNNDLLLTERAVAATARRLADDGLIEDPARFSELYHEVNASTEKPFISHTFSEPEIFDTVFRLLGVTDMSPEDALRLYRGIVVEQTVLEPGVREALDYLASEGIRAAILSNERSARVDAYLEKTGIRDCFHTVVVSEEVGIEKPEPEIFRETLRRLGIPPERAGRVAMFGDNSIADGACKREGMVFVLVTGFKNRKWYFERGDEFTPDYEIETVSGESLERVLNSRPAASE